MFLFIFESIGTSELILVGIVALIFLGPRKLPELAKKAGKIMSEFRGTANEFKETWQREVDFAEEAKALDLKEIEAESVARDDSTATPDPTEVLDAPAIRAVDPAQFEHLVPKEEGDADAEATESIDVPDENNKQNWL